MFSPDFVPTFKFISDTQAKSLAGIKLPHSVSQPVIRLVDGEYRMATFTFFYKAQDLKKGFVERPSRWTSYDLEKGNMLSQHASRNCEFSDASYGVKYLFKGTGTDTSKEYYEKTFSLFDEVRSELLETGVLNKEKYNEYLDRVTANVPVAYKRFFRDLSV